MKKRRNSSRKLAELQQNSITISINGQSTQKFIEAISDPGEIRVFIINGSTMKKLEIEPRNLKIVKVAHFLSEKTIIP